MNTALIIICIVFCVGVILWALIHFGAAITIDKIWRERIGRYHFGRRVRGGPPTSYG